MRYNIGDLFLSGKETLLYISSYSDGPSELFNNEYTEFYRLTFLNGKQQGKSTWVHEQKIDELVYNGTYQYIPAKEKIE